MSGRWRGRVEAAGQVARQWSATNDENFNRERLLRRAGGAPGCSAKPPPYDRMIRMIRMTRRAGAAPMPGRCREASMPGWLQAYNNKANLDKFYHVFSSCRATCPSSPGELGQGTWTTAGCRVTSSLSVTPRFQREAGPDSTTWPRAETRTWTRTWTRNLDKFYHVFSSCRATCPSSPGELGQGTWTTAGCRYKLSQCYAPIPGRPRFHNLAQGGNPNLDKNLDKELGQVLSRVFLLQSHLSKFARGTWTRNLDNCGLPCYKLSQCYAPIPGRPRFHNLAQGGNPNLDKNLDKELGQVLSRVFFSCRATCPSSPRELGQGTWTTAGCRYKLSQCYAPIPGRPRFRVPCLSL